MERGLTPALDAAVLAASIIAAMPLPPSAPPDDATAQQMRSLTAEIFKTALGEATVESAFREHVHCERGVLRICQDLYDLSAQDRVFVVSIGKASYAMARALQEQVGRRLEGIAAGPAPAPDSLPGFRVFCGGHPLPTAESIRAAEAILGALSVLGSTGLVIFLVSGGGSAMVERPAFDSISLAHLVDTYNALVLSGATIVEINTIRKHLSAVKGGRMALAAAPARQVSIFVSDVPDNAPDSLASGPTMPDSSTVNDCYGLVQRLSLLPQLPAPVRDIFSRRMLQETPKADDPAFARSRWWTVLSNSVAQRHAAQAASRAGFAVQMDSSCDDWDYAAAADYLLGRLRRLRQGASRVCLISGGEITVRVTGGGRGGRNQQFAIYCAQKIAGESIAVLSGGTDGIDGNTDAAGAVADGTTWARAVALGLDPAAALAGFDAYPVFRACDDLVITGATGNNVRDVRVLLAY